MLVFANTLQHFLHPLCRHMIEVGKRKSGPRSNVFLLLATGKTDCHGETGTRSLLLGSRSLIPFGTVITMLLRMVLYGLVFADKVEKMSQCGFGRARVRIAFEKAESSFFHSLG